MICIYYLNKIQSKKNKNKNSAKTNLSSTGEEY